MDPNYIDPNAPNPNPADLVDPMQQKKLAEGVLTQLGLHPNQAGARNLLDLHMQGGTADPAIAKPVSTLVDTKSSAPAAPAPLISAPAPEAPKPSTPEPIKPVPEVSKPDEVDSLISSGTPSVPSPSAASRIMGNTQDRTEQDQNELNRLIRTGSGISQIQNPFLRGLARTGDIVAQTVGLRSEPLIPGTEGHHASLIDSQKNLINTDLANSQTEANTEAKKAVTQKALETKNPNELAEWMKQNPNKPIAEFWKQKAAAQGGKRTPDQMQMQYLTTPKEEGGEGLTVDEAYQKMVKEKGAGKPITGAQIEDRFQGILKKALTGNMNPSVMTDPQALIDAIDKSPNITDEEKQQAHAYISTKNTPASAGGVAKIRNQSILARGLTPVIDLQSGQLTLASPADHLRDPNRYVPAGPGATSMTKETAFRDMHFNEDLVRSAFHGLKNGLDTETRAKLALTLSRSDPTAWDSFWKSSVGQSLRPDQIDLVTALQALHENALAMRSVQGLGQGSDELRAAIRGMVPGAETPSIEQADRQLNIFHGILQRYESGVPKSGVKPPAYPEVPKTGEAAPDEMPPKEMVDKMADKQFIWNKDHTKEYQKINGVLQPVKRGAQ